ncbi:MAG: RagB/SusD family nutrient uptake outer membrane protein [Bacteroidota bacterium]
MKTLLYIVFTFSLAVVFWGCQDDFLTDAAQPLDRFGGNDFYDSPDKIQSGVNAIYFELYDLYARPNLLFAYVNISDNGAQDNTETDVTNTFGKRLVDGDVANASNNIWQISYKIISKSNIIEDAIETGFPDFQGDPALSRSMGEARFMRAYAYLTLVTIFGDVPLLLDQPVTIEEASALTRNPVSSVWEQAIIPDLEYAAENCWVKSQLVTEGLLGSAPQAAAKLALAEAYLFNDRPGEAEAVLEEVVASGEYSLLPDFSALWGGNDNNAESIFEIQFNFGETGRANDYTRLLPFELQGIGGFQFTTQISVPTDDLVNAMEGDTRFLATLDTGLYDIDSIFVEANHWRKYTDFSIGAGAIENDWNINLMRYADVLHLLAEAEIRQDKVAEGMAHVNETRARASMPLFSASVSQSEALDLYLEERRLEFAGEMKRWRDLLRTEKTVEVIEEFLGTSIPESQLLWPIPEGEIEANPDGIFQNPGY